VDTWSEDVGAEERELVGGVGGHDGEEESGEDGDGGPGRAFGSWHAYPCLCACQVCAEQLCRKRVSELEAGCSNVSLGPKELLSLKMLSNKKKSNSLFRA
jgi:hypothetical protein